MNSRYGSSMLTARRGSGSVRTGRPTAASTSSHDQPLIWKPSTWF
jgi:hypothetical protein